MSPEEINQLLIILSKALVAFICIETVYYLIKRVNALRNSKVFTCYVKTAFISEFGNDKQNLDGDLVYYTQSDFENELKSNNITLKDYIVAYLPTLNFPITPISHNLANSVRLPKRVILSKEILGKYETITVVGNMVMVSLTKVPGENACWFGTCITTDNSDFARILVKKYIKEHKHDPKSYVVWSSI